MPRVAREVLPTLFALGAIWGLTPALGKRLILSGGWPPLLVALAAAAGSAAILLLVCRARGQAVPWDRAHLRHYAVAGVSSLALANFFALTSLQYAPAGLFARIQPSPEMLMSVRLPGGMRSECRVHGEMASSSSAFGGASSSPLCSAYTSSARSSFVRWTYSEGET